MQNFLRPILAAVSVSLLPASLLVGSTSLNFTNGTSSSNSASVAPGGIFAFSVKMIETASSDQVSGVDYQIRASNNAVFEFLSRNSQVSGSTFTYANGFADSSLSTVVLNPNNGTNLGTSTSSGAAVAGPGTYEISDFSFEVLPGTPTGVYTLSFANTDTSGAAPSYAVGSFAALGTYTVFVPGPPLLGDANLDGKIDGSDYSIIDNTYLNEHFVNGVATNPIGGYKNGDFNLDGVVDGTDYTLIDNGFNVQTPSPSAAVSASVAGSVPEPISLAMTSVSLIFLGRRNRLRPPC